MAGRGSPAKVTCSPLASTSPLLLLLALVQNGPLLPHSTRMWTPCLFLPGGPQGSTPCCATPDFPGTASLCTGLALYKLSLLPPTPSLQAPQGPGDGPCCPCKRLSPSWGFPGLKDASVQRWPRTAAVGSQTACGWLLLWETAQSPLHVKYAPHPTTPLIIFFGNTHGPGRTGI